MSYEVVYFRLFEMPCCGQLICWVNPRMPNYCPECGKFVYSQLKSGEHHHIEDRSARLEVNHGN